MGIAAARPRGRPTSRATRCGPTSRWATRPRSTIFDLDAQKMYIFESGKKEADVWDMGDFLASRSATPSTPRTSRRRSSRTARPRQFGSLTANGYDMEISVPATLGGNKDMAMTVTLVGPVWIVKDAPGAADYNRFYKAARREGLDLQRPARRQGAAGPGQGDGRDVPPVRRDRRHRLRERHPDQDEQRGCGRSGGGLMARDAGEDEHVDADAASTTFRPARLPTTCLRRPQATS